MFVSLQGALEVLYVTVLMGHARAFPDSIKVPLEQSELLKERCWPSCCIGE